MKNLIFLGVLGLLVACSNQQMYKAARHYERSICQQEQGAAYDECMARTHQSYEDYEREREQAVKPE